MLDELVLHYLIHTPPDTPVSLPSISLPFPASNAPNKQTFEVSLLHSPTTLEFSCFSFSTSVYQHLDHITIPMAAPPILPVFTPASVTSISTQEWQDFCDEVDLFFIHISTEIAILNPQVVIEQTPQSFVDNPTAPMACLATTGQASAWLGRLQVQQLQLQLAAPAAQIGRAHV